VLLAIDVGNTNTVVGVFEADAPEIEPAARAAGELAGFAHHWRVSTVPERTADELALLLNELLALDGLRLPRRDRSGAAAPPAAKVVAPKAGAPKATAAKKAAPRAAPPTTTAPTVAPRPAAAQVTGIAVSSTVPVVTGALREMAQRFFDCPLVVVGPGIKTGIPIRFDNPKEVGPDRIANAVAAVDLHGGPAVVVDLGTATTFDIVSAADEYVGGIIVPGLGISMEALVSRAAALRRVELTLPRSVIGRTTVEAMQSGALYGQAALVEGLCARISEEIGAARIIITGGFGPVIAPQLRGTVHNEPWLTLHGLRLLYERNLDGVLDLVGG
jgi:type III pantothenate kinase